VRRRWSRPRPSSNPLGSQRIVPYDPPAVEAFFDEFGQGEWERFDRFALGAVHEHIHNHYLERFVTAGSRVLDIGAGPGRFTQTLHRLGCRIVVADISEVQLELNRRYGAEKGFGMSVEAYHKLDICDLSGLPTASFDVVVVYGGPLSYVFERRDDAMASCRRVLRPGGLLLASVMSLWGTLHRHLAALRDLPLAGLVDIVATGDLTPENDPTSRHKCHMFSSSELVTLLERHGFVIEALSTSNALSTNREPLLLELRQQPDRWHALLELERRATAQPGYVDGGTHLIAAARAGPLAA
jgi:2-polyprenyl-3-methyl-5-hydroxy-6-metoxy-1,4-benzoquinol methylase